MLKKYQNLSPREKVLLSALGLLLLFTGLYRFVLEKQITAYLENKSKLVETRQQLAMARSMLAGEKAQRQKAKDVEKKLASVLPFFDTQVQSGGALVDLSWKAYQCRVSIEGVKPMPVVDKQYHLEIPLTLKISGQYLDIVEFLKELENLPNASEIRRADFSPGNQGTPANVVGTTTEVSDWHQNGEIDVELDMVLFSHRAPVKTADQARKLMESWAVGRANAFQSVEPVSHLEEITIPTIETNSIEKDFPDN
ncbi:type IV pilus assembly protein PilO [Desulforamulus putei DSM 12395]|uniref:Type IV pilus assembly protein PilO n=1 Tax=Desulforamulus putei DSM 12395 TaxID=1121429 RepID=A0A1M4UVR2_9FIRM|nr:type 4a pilus biogenesis protein PilO [Desulforamulus putei]SHE60826.1 type IV pilus assembly protein PilO [Desulforamulus putei DSM 12395]